MGYQHRQPSISEAPASSVSWPGLFGGSGGQWCPCALSEAPEEPCDSAEGQGHDGSDGTADGTNNVRDRLAENTAAA